MKGFDAHLILKGYERNVAQRGSQINAIPSNTEKFIAFQIGKLRFLDSLQFLNASVDSLVNTLPPNAFNLVSKFSLRQDLVKIKVIYPYKYMTDISKFRETRLPTKEMFYIALNESEITDEEYQRAQDAWTAFDCKALQNFYDAYLMTDVLLFGDVFKHFRSLCI